MVACPACCDRPAWSRTFLSAEALLAEMSPGRPSCLLLDITLPTPGGQQAREGIESLGKALPVIALSAGDDEQIQARAKAVSVKMFLRKPVDDQALLDAIHWVTSPPPTAPAVSR